MSILLSNNSVCYNSDNCFANSYKPQYNYLKTGYNYCCLIIDDSRYLYFSLVSAFQFLNGILVLQLENFIEVYLTPCLVRTLSNYSQKVEKSDHLKYFFLKVSSYVYCITSYCVMVGRSCKSLITFLSPHSGLK